MPPVPRLPHERLRWAQDEAIATCGRIAQFWGFTRSMGRTFGLLYVTATPLTQAEVQRRLRISAGNASMTLAALIRWNVVSKAAGRGHARRAQASLLAAAHRGKVRQPAQAPRDDRRERYLAETDFWKMISGVLNLRERKEIRAAIAAMTRAEEVAREARRSFRGAERDQADRTASRLAGLREICTVGETMLDLLLGQLSLDVARFRDVFRRDDAPSLANPE
jgi:DNA-binding transcriptional regulator GbsR (MarR family)